ncbi:hypothetical protein [Saccharopolyspora shandongensis]|uniref:hypothetical protein n=1 Tax=Saccharopolyspora shandongensis TaxID=418495 RepID=UPI0033CF6837
MAVKITDERMTSDLTTHWAIPVRSEEPRGEWVVSWLHDRHISRNAAITGMTLAELVTEDVDKHAWSTFAQELDVSVDEAVERITYGFEFTGEGKRAGDSDA